MGALNGANSRMLSVITDKTQKEEASDGSRTFDLLMWIRARRIQWLDPILRMDDGRLIKRAVKVMYEASQEGDLLMYSWMHLHLGL